MRTYTPQPLGVHDDDGGDDVWVRRRWYAVGRLDDVFDYMVSERSPATYCFCDVRLWETMLIFAVNARMCVCVCVCVCEENANRAHTYIYIYTHTTKTYRTKTTTSGHCRNGSGGTVASAVVVSSSWPFPRRPLDTTAQHTAHYNILHTAGW